MSTPTLRQLVARDRAVLVLQELQYGVVGESSSLRELAEAAERVGVVANSRQLATAARAAGVSVVHATAEELPGGFGSNNNARLFAAARAAGVANEPGSKSAQPLAELFDEGDLVAPRHQGLSPLAGTELDALLRNAGVTTIVVAGVSLNVAIPNLTFDAVNQSYRVVIVRDAVAGVPIGYGEQVVQHTLKLLAELTTTDELAQIWMS